LGQQFTTAHIDRHVVSKALYDISGVPRHMLVFAEKGCRLPSGIKRHPYHLGALGYKHTFVRLQLHTQLSLRQSAKHANPTIV
jgi:hypothetical protein